MKTTSEACPACGGTIRLGHCNLCEMFATGQTPGVAAPGSYPKRSIALAVDPSQVEEANERNRRHGVRARYERDGTAVVQSRADQKELLKLEGLRNNDGGYGD